MLINLLFTIQIFAADSDILKEDYGYRPPMLSRKEWVNTIEKENEDYVNIIIDEEKAQRLFEYAPLPSEKLARIVEEGSKLTTLIYSNTDFEEFWNEEYKSEAFVKQDERISEHLPKIYGTQAYRSGREAGLNPFEAMALSATITTLSTTSSNSSNKNEGLDYNQAIDTLISASLGETSIVLKRYVEGNKGKFIGSQELGTMVLLITNPSDTIRRTINRMTNTDIVQEAEVSLSPVDTIQYADTPFINSNTIIGLEIKLRVGN